MKISRRRLFKLIFGGTAAATTSAFSLLALRWQPGGDTAARQALASSPSPPPLSSAVWHDLAMTVNGKSETLRVKANWTLLKVLREDLHLTGTKPGCQNGECGACTVLADGAPIYSCQKLAAEMDGRGITTIEGLSTWGMLSAVQQAFIDEGGSQCGYCTPGFVMAAMALLTSNPRPSAAEVTSGLSGNICRCGNYPHIIKAVLSAAQRSCL